MSKERCCIGMRSRKKSGTGIGIISFVVLILFAIVAYSRVGLEDRYDEAKLKTSRLEAQIEDENERKKEIENFKAYVQTKSYIEEIARDKLGLVYEDEYIFKRQE